MSIIRNQNIVNNQRMQNNYDRLFLELAELVNDRKVYESLDNHLKTRVDSLLGTHYEESPSQTIQQLSCHDTEHLFNNDKLSPKDPSTECFFLKETNSNHAKRKQTLNSSGRITAKKIEISAFDEDKKTSKPNKNMCRVTSNNQNRSKSTKELVRYNLQTSKSKSKSKQKTLKGLNQCPSKKSINGRNDNKLQKSIQKITIVERPGKENRKNVQEKADGKKFKKPSKNVGTSLNQNANMFAQPRLKTNNSNIHQSREILKRLATMQTQPSRTSLSSNKGQNLKQKKSMKMNEKDMTVMEAINQKYQATKMQKRQLQNDIRQLQQMIEYQRSRLESANNNIKRIDVQISQKQFHQRSSSQEFKISRKKSQHFISQSRQIQSKIVETNKSKGTVLASIEEQKYLINMYLTVIEQIKSQLKIEQSQKIDLIKKLVIIKNTQKMCMEKYLSKEGLSQQMFRTINQSMKKWA